MAKPQYEVTGQDDTPDGYRDTLMYTGSSKWQVFKAVRAALANNMTATIKRSR